MTKRFRSCDHLQDRKRLVKHFNRFYLLLFYNSKYIYSNRKSVSGHPEIDVFRRALRMCCHLPAVNYRVQDESVASELLMKCQKRLYRLYIFSECYDSNATELRRINKHARTLSVCRTSDLTANFLTDVAHLIRKISFG